MLQQTFTVTGSAGGPALTGVAATLTQNDGGTFTIGNPVASGSGYTVTVALARGSFPTNTVYNGNVQVTATGYTAVDVPISLTVGNCTPSGGGGGTPGGPITVNKTLVALNAPPNSFASDSSVTLAAVSGTVNYSIQVTPTNSWLQAATGTSTLTTTPQSLAIFATTTGLALGSYNGTVSIIANGTTAATINVTLTVGTGSGGLTVSQNPINLSVQPGGTTSTILTVSSTTATSYNATAIVTTPAGGNWLTINGTTFTGASLPASLNVGANAISLAAGTYQGSVTIIAGSDTVSIAVNLTVGSGGGSGVLTFNPYPLSFNAPAGSTSLLSQVMSVTSSTGGLNFTASPSSSGWLSVSPSSGSVGSYITVYANPTGLATGSYSGSILFTTSGAGQYSATVPVTLVIGAGGSSGVAAPSSLTFSYQSGSSTPPSEILLVSGLAGTAFTATSTVTTPSGGTWLSVSPASGTISPTGSAQVVVSIAPATLAQSSYSGAITVSSSNGTVVIPVSLIVTSLPVLTMGPYGTVVAEFAQGGAAQTQNLFLTSSSSTQQLTFSATPSVSWIQVTTTTTTTPATLALTLSPQGLPAGLNTANVTFAAAGAGNTPLVVPVTVNVSGGLSISSTNLSFSSAPGGGAQSQVVSVTAPTSTSFSATASSAQGWLSVSPNSASTPANLTIYATPGSLAAGTYNGTVAIVSGSSTQNISVTLTITGGGGGGGITVSPTSLSFQWQVGTAAPQSQALTLATGTSGTTFTASATVVTGPAGWLSVSPASGSAPANLTVSINTANLSAGTYLGTVTVTPGSGSPVQAQVNLTVTGAAAPTLTVSPANLSFAYSAGGSAPATQSITVGSSGAPLTFTAAAASSGWLSVTPASGTTPGTLTVKADPGTLSAGTYVATIAISSPSAASQTVNVTFTVTAPLPTISKLTNAASYTGTAIAPGEIVVFFGTALGPATLTTLALDQAGMVATTLAGTQVLFNGVPAPIIYTSSTQVSAVVPYQMAGRKTASVWISYLGASSNSVNVEVAPTAPGIFTANASGTGPGAILNQDSSVNSAGNPAAKGSVVVLYATGEGQTVPAGVTGSVTSGVNPPQPVLPVAVLVDGQPADVLYAGSAPGLVAGVFQVNIRIPPNVSSGAVPVTITMGGLGGNSSQAGVTVAVQ